MSKLLQWWQGAWAPRSHLLRFGRPSRRTRQAIAAGNAARDGKRHGEAARHYRKALDRDPTLAAIEVQYGHMLKEAGDLRASEAAYRRALQLTPGEADTHRQLGHVRKLLGDWTGALQAYTRACELDPMLDDLQQEMEDAAARLDASSLAAGDEALLRTAGEAVDRRDWQQAVEGFATLVRHRPDLSTLWVRHGLALTETGQRFPALRAFQHAVALRPHLGRGWLSLARALAALDEDVAAQQAHGRAAALQPSSPMILAGPAVRESRGNGEEDALWPRFGDSPLPPRIRALLADRDREDALSLYTHLLGVVAAFAAQPASFRAKTDATLLLERVTSAAARRTAATIRASIVIPVYNNLVYTLTCIASVLEHGARAPFEIIVGDDRSSDETFAVLSSIGGCVRVVQHATNRGFLHNCNETAAFARGDIIVMLNNDTLVLPEWLDALMRTFEACPAAGLVGSKLINQDGTLQEAGGIVWRDASGWNFGRNADPALPEYNYLKDVDYVSGASIAIPAVLWTELGGFDPIYAPGYCEDSDLAFRVRAAGRRALYQPASAVIHHEGRSHGRDINAGVKANQRVNRQKLKTRWQAALEVDHFARGESVFVARDRSRWKPHILFITPSIPQWDRDGVSRTLYGYLKLFAERGFQVTLWPEHRHAHRTYLDGLQDLGIEVLDVRAGSEGFQNWFGRKGPWIDYAFVSHSRISSSDIDRLAGSRTKILDYPDPHHARRASRNDDPTARPAFHVVLTSSSQEADEIRGLRGGRTPVAAIPISKILSDAALEAVAAKLASPERADPCALMFVGALSAPRNADAITWFVTTVMPLVRQQHGGVHLRVAGSQAPQAVVDLASDHVAILGRISDDELRELYATSAVAVVPMRQGAGVSGKLIEAFGNGTPVVSTSIGAQGIANSADLAFLADDPSDFARQILRAMADREDALRRAKNAVAFLRRHHAESSAVAALAPYVPELGDSPALSRAGPH